MDEIHFMNNVDSTPKRNFIDTEEKLFFQPWEISWILLENILLFQDFMIHYQAFFRVSVSGYPQWRTIDLAFVNVSESPGKRPVQL